MKTIEYRVEYTGKLLFTGGVAADTQVTGEIVRVQARDINSGYSKALKRALEPLGSGARREIGRIEFWQIV